LKWRGTLQSTKSLTLYNATWTAGPVYTLLGHASFATDHQRLSSTTAFASACIDNNIRILCYVDMAPARSYLGHKLRSLGRKLLRRADPAQKGTALGVADENNDDGESAQDVPRRVDEVLDENDGDGENLQDVPGFLKKSLDPHWIDIEMMGYWLQKCETEHGDKCCNPLGLDMSSLGRPELLIDIRKKCLVAAEPGHRYACLSYVWGGAATLKAEKGNIDSLMQDRALELYREEIPGTIRDTIGLVDQLGIPYLWVDSLCIVQDDTEAKGSQIQAMAGIYAKAYVTIIAGNGWDANHGLRGIQGVTEPRQLSPFLKNSFRDNLQPYSGIWYSRGWTFQEMIFSPRKIMFQYRLVIWECSENSWHEASLSKVSALPGVAQIHTSINRWASQVQFSALPDVKQYVDMAYEFATRKLTYPQDAWNAISSLLSVMSSSFVGGFISGLPEMFLNEALLWQPREPMQRRVPTDADSLLPSWSWIGWEGEITKDEWVDHFSHLYLSRSLPPSSSREVVLQVRPLVKWFYGNTLQERLPAHVVGDNYIGHLADKSTLPVPADWSYDEDAQGFYHHDKNGRRTNEDPFNYPLPTASSPSPRLTPARYLFCRTTRGVFKINHQNFDWTPRQASLIIGLEDSTGNGVGALNLDLDLTDFTYPPYGTEYELVAIAAGSLIHDSYDMGEVSALLDWGNFVTRTGTPPSDPRIVDFCYVFWIGWKDGIAYRRGLGRVFKPAWDREATEIDLVLG
jgi:hypothetical protein